MKTVLPKKMKRLIGKINHRVCGSKTYDEIYVSVVIVSATRRIRDIKIPFCLSAPMRKSLIL